MADVKVNGRVVSSDEIEAALALLEEAKAKAAKKEFTPTERKVRTILLAEAAERAGMTVSREEIAARVALIPKRTRKPKEEEVTPEA